MLHLVRLVQLLPVKVQLKQDGQRKECRLKEQLQRKEVGPKQQVDHVLGLVRHWGTLYQHSQVQQVEILNGHSMFKLMSVKSTCVANIKVHMCGNYL